MPRSLPLLLAVLSGCSRPQAPLDPSKDLLVAVVERSGGLDVQRFDGSAWRTTRRLPSAARALRFSRSGLAVAWVTDEQREGKTVPIGWAWPPEAPTPLELGTLGLRTKESFGLAIDDAGRSIHLALDGTLVDSAGKLKGKGALPVFGDGGRLAWVNAKNCIVAEGLPALKACGPAVHPFELGAGLVWGTQQGLEKSWKGPWNPADPQQVVDARVNGRGDVLIVHRGDRDGFVVERVTVAKEAARFERHTAAVVIAANWASDGDDLLLVRRESRKDLYESLLAHAPEEFGGEAIGGDAIRLHGLDAKPIEGLGGLSVRTVFVPKPP